MVLEGFPVEAAGNADDRSRGAIRSLEVVANVVKRDGFERGGVALAGAAPGVGVMAAPQFQHHLLGRFVLDGAQLLIHHLPAGLQLIRRQMGPPEHVGKYRQRFVEIPRQGGRAEARMRFPHRFAAFYAQAIQVVDELAAVSRAGSAERHFAGETAQPAPVGRLVDAAGRDEDRECRRLQPVHRFGHEDQAVAKNVGLDHLLSG